MAGFTDYVENAILNYIHRAVAMPAIANIYVGLLTAMPVSDAGSGATEVSGGAYVRQLVTRGLTEWKDPSTATQGLTENVNAITYPTATANWGTIVGVETFDAASGGNALEFAGLTANKIVNTGDVFKFNAGDLDITLD